jgi:hypothetical protein
MTSNSNGSAPEPTGLVGRCFHVRNPREYPLYDGHVVGDLGNQFYLVERTTCLPGDRVVLGIYHINEMRSWDFFYTEEHRKDWLDTTQALMRAAYEP